MEHANAVRFREATEAMASGDGSLLVELLADDIEWWELGASQPIRGKAALIAQIAEPSDFKISVELHDLFANDEHLVSAEVVVVTNDREIVG